MAEDLQSKNSMLQSSKKQLSNVLEEYTKKNAELERKIKKLEAELDKAKSHDNELQALRELAFSLNQNTSELTDNGEISEANYEFLNSINALVVGGNLNWQKKMKEKLPQWKYIDASVRKFNKVLLNCDIIILNTYSMNHSLFYFVMDNVDKDVKIHFINRTNIDECICGIWDKIKK